MKKRLLPIILIVSLILSVHQIFAQILLYKVPEAYIYPEIYAVQQVDHVSSLSAMSARIASNSGKITAYLVGSDSASMRIRKFNTDALPHITFMKINPTLYQISFSNTDEDVLLIFNQRFHPGWTVRSGTEPVTCVDKKELSRFSVTACNGNQERYPFLLTLLLPFTHGKVSTDHTELNHFVNAWYLPKGSPKNVYLTFDVESYMFAGILVSGGTILFLIIVLLWYFIRRRKK